ncbi:MAG: hypothetical protein H6Q69_1689 [Firmicutes bacterium]|nr:hypothetical protein [Bacillota bacterium]
MEDEIVDERNGGRTVTPDEVCKELQQIGANVSRRVLLNYENAGLIPIPERSSGKRGRYTNYPPETVEEAFAAWSLIRGKINNPLLIGIIHTVSYDAIKIVRDSFYRNEDILLTANQYARFVVQAAMTNLEKKGWKYEGKDELPTVEEEFVDIHEDAAKKIYEGIQLLWQAERKRAQILLTK